MRGFADITAVGNILKIDELRESKKGRKVTNFVMICKRKVKGMSRSVTFPVVVWDDLAEICVNHLSPGVPILVKGELEGDKYVKNETEFTSLKLKAHSVTILDSSIKVKKVV